MASVTATLQIIKGLAKDIWGDIFEEETNAPKKQSIRSVYDQLDFDSVVKEGQEDMKLDTTGRPTTIDWGFIRELEGFRTDGYVPQEDGAVLGHSGVTIGSGIDLGQWDKKSLTKLGVDKSVLQKLQPYFGLEGEAAVSAVEQNPLILSDSEAKDLSERVKTTVLKGVMSKYNDSSELSWEDLPPEWKTVITSVAFQYGDLESRTPAFWGYVTSGDFEKAHEELRNFGDKFDTRRNKEADLVQNFLTIDNERNV